MRQLYFIILLYKEMFRPELIFLQPLKRFFSDYRRFGHMPHLWIFEVARACDKKD